MSRDDLTHKPRLGSRAVLLAIAVVTLHGSVGGCNAILDNKPGQLDEHTSEVTPVQPGALPTAEPEPETPTPSPTESPGPGPTNAICPTGKHACHGACVADDDPAYGCGSATCAPCVVRHGTAACKGGACVIASCDPGFADCNLDRADGCEADLSRATGCGRCGNACPTFAPMCAPQGTSYACESGCPATAPLLCGKECVAPLTSITHCGVCSHACPAVDQATVQCTLGICAFTCKAGYHACSGKCVVATDPSTCGPTCTVCPNPPNAVATCPTNACYFSCRPGYGDCNRNATDGCEAVLADDPKNCGACGNVCASGICLNGVCLPTILDAGANADGG